MIIRGAKVFTPDFRFEEKDIYIEETLFAEGAVSAGKDVPAEKDVPAGKTEEVLDAKGLYAFPGLVDIHFHGAVGYDFCDASAEQLEAIAEYEAANGITAICPATMTYPEEKLNQVVDTAVGFAALQKDGRRRGESLEASHRETDGKVEGHRDMEGQDEGCRDMEGRDEGCRDMEGRDEGCRQQACPETDRLEKAGRIKLSAADLVGINMEGPFISPKKLGAQNPEYVQKPDVQMARRLMKRSGNLFKLIDIAPEVEGAMEFIEEMKGEAVISLAHNTASYEVACEAFRRGASHVTHLFDAMPDISHREPGPAIAALEKGAEVELIADGIHIHPAIVRFVFRTFGADKVILIADSMEATGLPDGEYQLGGQAVTKKGSLAVLTEHPDVIAGSVTNLYDCMKNAVQNMGVPLTDALRAATINPARSIGIDDRYGTIEPGKKADLVLADANLNIRCVIKDGQMIRKD